MSGAMIDAVNQDPFFLTLNGENDPVRKVNQLANFKRELSLLQDQRTALRERSRMMIARH